MKMIVFFSIFFSSIIGITAFGISINKIALVPLEIFLFFKTLYTIKKGISFSSQHIILLLWYAVLIFGSLFGVLFTSQYIEPFLESTIQKATFQIVQVCLLYIPISILLTNFKDKKILINIIKESFVRIARIQAIWALGQFIIYYQFDLDINNIIFNLFSSEIENKWTAFNNIGGLVLMRPTGLNSDPAFLGLLLVLGTILEKSKIWKIFFFSILILACSRSGIITIIILYLYNMFNKNKKITLNESMRIACIFVIVSIFAIEMYNQIPAISNQVDRMLNRMIMISEGGDGTERHTGYLIAALRILFLSMPFLYIFFGIGIPISGIAFNVFNNDITEFQLNTLMLNSIWVIESDFASVLIGSGIVGITLYYLFYLNAYLKIKDKEIKEIIFCLVLFGLMYNIATLTFIQFIFWVILLKYNDETKNIIK